MDTKIMLNAALEYSRDGLAVFPCKPDKSPYVFGWSKAATTDEHQIRTWWAKWPNAMIGLLTGKSNGLWALDIDRPKKDGDADGMDTLKEWKAKYGLMPDTWTQKTPSEGRHYIFRYPAGEQLIRNSVKKVGAGIDVRGEGGYIIISPSANEKGSYELVNDVSPVDAPAWLLEMVSGKPAAKQPVPSLLPLQANNLAMGLHPYVEKALNANMLDVANAKPGTRNDTLFKMLAPLAGFIPNGLLDETTLRAKAEEAFMACHPDDYDASEFEKTFVSAVEIGKANPRTIPPKLPAGFRIVKEGRDAGLWYDEFAKKEDAPPNSIRIGAPLYVLALFRNDKRIDWGRLLEWTDPDGTLHRYLLPDEQLAGSDASVWRSQLAKEGYSIGSGKKCHELLARYLTNCQPERRMRCVYRTGWHGEAFVLPDKVLPASSSDSIVLLNPPSRNPYVQGGTFEDWQKTIGTWAAGNSRLLFALCASLAAPLLEMLRQESGGFNWTGVSSTGKTTALFAAASVWGKGSLSDGYILPWRSTDNGLEAQAALHSDTALCLDELSQVPPRVLQETAYMLGNSQGKARANRRGTGREIKSWRTIFLSTGEVGLVDKLAEEGRKAHAGQTVRMIDILADAGVGMGLFENLHDFTSAQAFADAIKQAATTNYGHAGPAFIETLCKNRNDVLTSKCHSALADLAARFSSPDADAQVKRVASRFALCCIAGMMAAKCNIIPVPIELIIHATESCFRAWLDARGSSGAWEDKEIVDRVNAFIEAHVGRFQLLGSNEALANNNNIPMNRAGFRITKDKKTTFYFLGEVFKKEICQGIPYRRACKALYEAGILRKDTDGHYATKLSRELPDLGRKRVYAVCLQESDEL